MTTEFAFNLARKLDLEIGDLPDLDVHYNLLREKWIARDYPKFHSAVWTKYSFAKKWSEILYDIRNNINFQPVCLYCKKPVKYLNPAKGGYQEYCSSKCVNSAPEVQNKKKETSLINYEVEYPARSPLVQEKTKQTNRKKFETDYPTQNKDVIKKRHENNQSKYGVNEPSELDEIKEKIKKTCLEKFEVDNPMKNKEIQEKSRKSLISKYGENYKEVLIEKRKETYRFRTGYDTPFENPEVQDQIKQTVIGKYGVENISSLDWVKEKKKRSMEEYYKTHPELKASSKLEISYQDFLENSWYRIIRNDRDVLDGFELDILHVDYPLAIEINGMWWHSSKLKDENYHSIKFAYSFSKGIEMITVWEDYDFDLSCQFIIDKTEGRPLDKYKKKWFPDLNDNEWPADMGLPPSNRKIIGYKEHECMHGGHLCYDCGVFLLEP